MTLYQLAACITWSAVIVFELWLACWLVRRIRRQAEMAPQWVRDGLPFTVVELPNAEPEDPTFHNFREAVKAIAGIRSRKHVGRRTAAMRVTRAMCLPLLLVATASAQSPRVISYSLHSAFALPQIDAPRLAAELSQFEAMYESVCNVDIRRVSSGGVLFYSGRDSQAALGRAYLGYGKILIHNGTRDNKPDGPTDYWKRQPGLLAAVCAHEFWHLLRNNQNHYNDNACIMDSDIVARRFCPAEIATLQGMYGRPKAPPPGTFAVMGQPSITFGDGTMVGMAGRFDGMQTGLALYDPKTSFFHIRFSLTGTGTDRSFQFGAPGKNRQGIIGDWDGNGRWDVGLYDPATGEWFLRNSLSPGPADRVVKFGPAQSQALNGQIGVYVRK